MRWWLKGPSLIHHTISTDPLHSGMCIIRSSMAPLIQMAGAAGMSALRTALSRVVGDGAHR